MCARSDEDELAELRKVMLSAEGAEDSADSADELTDDFLLTATQVLLAVTAEQLADVGTLMTGLFPMFCTKWADAPKL